MQLVARDSTLDLSCPHIMGILNVTPDSFSDGGKHNKLDAALLHVQEMITAGATLIDIGGESTRPGAADVSTEEELNRVVPVVEAIAKRFDVWISVDTSKPEVMTASAQAGAHLINDIRALQEPGALEAAAATGLPVCLMHMQGMPRTMQHKPHYDDLMQDIGDFLQQQIDRCVSANIPKSKLLLDPGFGFGKNLAHNYALLARLSELHRFELPLLVGMSRKSMIGQILNVPPAQRVHGSVACAVIAAMQGAQIIRVHDVKETADAMRIVEATLSAKE
ncbi:dihydropteroate synthase [Pectobacterium carotovorum]|uniref:dihydropteroate synthase n=1 Tax=Pectobacterium carotovorum TaxID=554 RepID=UPI0001A44394|nr:dihydropteroate synthase [Pectobacterium carotovorum]KFX02200.1 dihydropteroate synthase [Pectobacterium carotovorum subsp. carotovorum]KHT32050.1 dihydropteroate synthase [Pectobacterium carotovorum subsp. carotovorum]KML72061.1 dihydropteroate synthase [Pectobacterium carotovorum subsp. carotovorum ICMP 5702]MDK9421830.1 dihydropteroate synthase [Pectobacterium carotovorum]QHP55670.1 dihydropteroate synthase [Pectobacterium carotovorum subsp. carotovorum]